LWFKNYLLGARILHTDGATADGKWINSRGKNSIIETENDTLEIFLVFA
jgi:hypothetical protein